MALKEYSCNKCGKTIEVLEPKEAKPATCPNCGGEFVSIISKSTFILKGSGWFGKE